MGSVSYRPQPERPHELMCKHPADVRNYILDFSKWGDGSLTVTSGAPVTDSGDVVVAESLISGAEYVFTVSGGTEDSVLTVPVTLSNSEVVNVVCSQEVRTPA